jgi:hypothetical protein
MNNHHFEPQDILGRRLAVHLDEANQTLAYDITERLRAARMRAVAARKVSQLEWQTVSDVQLQNGVLSLKPDHKFQWLYQAMVSLLPLVCLSAGLVFLYDFHNDQSALELAEVDSALLIDDLPPQAYADPAFAHFLKSNLGNKE